MYPHHLHQGICPRPFPKNIKPLPLQMQRVEVIFLYPELVHDIEAAIHQIETGRQTNTSAGSSALLPAGGSSSYILQRHIDTAVNQAVARCQAYLILPSPYVHRISTDHAGQWEEKSIFLALPPDWSPHCIEPLRDAIHNFIVYRALQLFLTFSDEKAAAKSDAMAQTYYDDINAQLNTRLGPHHIYPSFLG